jgi:putative redox protein
MAAELHVQLRQLSATTTEAAIGGHKVLVDRALEKGGSGLGPMGGELFLASIGGCFMSNLLAAIRARELGVSDVRTEVTGTVDGAPARFTGITLRVTAANTDAETLRKLVDIADRGCIMMNTLRGKLDVRIDVEQTS